MKFETINTAAVSCYSNLNKKRNIYLKKEVSNNPLLIVHLFLCNLDIGLLGSFRTTLKQFYNKYANEEKPFKPNFLSKFSKVLNKIKTNLYNSNFITTLHKKFINKSS